MLLATWSRDHQSENPDEGDPSRKNFPFVKEVSSYFLSVNRGKRASP